MRTPWTPAVGVRGEHRGLRVEALHVTEIEPHADVVAPLPRVLRVRRRRPVIRARGAPRGRASPGARGPRSGSPRGTRGATSVGSMTLPVRSMRPRLCCIAIAIAMITYSSAHSAIDIPQLGAPLHHRRMGLARRRSREARRARRRIAVRRGGALDDGRLRRLRASHLRRRHERLREHRRRPPRLPRPWDRRRSS